MRTSYILIVLGLAIGILLLWLSGWFALRLIRFFFRHATASVLYKHIEWLGPASLMLTLASFYVSTPNVRPFTWIPPDAAWWEAIVFGITVTWLGSLSMVFVFGPIAVVGLILPWKLLSRHVLTRSTTLSRVAVSAMGVFLSISTVSAMAHMLIMWKDGGELIGPQGALFHEGNYGITAVGNTYYFSALTVLGAGFGEYQPTGLCRPVVLATVLLGKVLEIAVIATGVSFATAAHSVSSDTRSPESSQKKPVGDAGSDSAAG